MRKIITIVVVVAVSAAFTSCKKDYTCTCVTSANGVTMGTQTTTIHDTKSKATTTCNNMNTTVTVGGLSETAVCTLK